MAMLHISNVLVLIAGCWSLSTFVTAQKHHHEVPTFFWRLHKNGTAIDRSSPQYNEEIESKIWINIMSREDAASVKLTVWPDTVKNGEKVTLLWEGVENPQAKDMITYYCPFYDDYSHYLDYFYADVAAEWKNGYGHFDAAVYNMRESCAFKFYRLSESSNAYVLAATSNRLNFDDGGPYAPLQGHIALTNDPTEMRVMWVSGQVPYPPVVRYGLTKNLTMKENSYTLRTYTKDDMCQGPANTNAFWHPGITYDVLLKNLKPNTLYYYSYGTEKYTSPIANFTTALPKGDPTPFNFIIYGDMGVDPSPQAYSTAHNVRKDLDKYRIRFVSHIGDISYARGYAYIWEQWGLLIEPYATLVPYMVGIGNHEYDHTAGGLGRDPSNVETDYGWRPSWFVGAQDSGGECAVPMHKRYHMPDNGNSMFWYSYDYGMVHMITISLEHDFTPGSAQHSWLEKDLKSVDRKLTPWLFIGGHRPMYNSEIYPDYNFSLKMQDSFEDLLYEFKVDIAFWAHMHAYERTCKLYKNECVDDGVIHLTVGMAGKSLDMDTRYVKAWSLVHFYEYGYGRVTVANSSSLLFEMFGNKANKVLDHIWLHK